MKVMTYIRYMIFFTNDGLNRRKSSALKLETKRLLFISNNFSKAMKFGILFFSIMVSFVYIKIIRINKKANNISFKKKFVKTYDPTYKRYFFSSK